MRRALLAVIAIALTVGGLTVGQPSGSSATPDEVVRDSAPRHSSS
ncbi:hypothetical protein [Nocardioides sp. S5]|nr:hypothetical protein [Nocardioides sp. S5]